MSAAEAWYVVQQETGHCAILQEGSSSDRSASDPSASNNIAPSPQKQWGPFESQAAAIARRVGLIRAGKCQPQ